ncbi:MAG: hypothetical protein QG564_1806 [Campylobacterota bacterium]|nr:hypothetical protein [Campylobacterota bacterium]
MAMIKLKTNNNTTSVSIDGKEYKCKNEILEIDEQHSNKLIGYGFELYIETVIEVVPEVEIQEVVEVVEDAPVAPTKKTRAKK